MPETCDLLNVKFENSEKVLQKREAIKTFFMFSDASHCCPGKKD